jgi:high-affinity iron transporter
MIRTLLAISLFAFSFTSQAANAVDPQHSPRFLVHILDYLAKDYAGAVSPDGKILSKSEYSEQVEFVESAVSTNKGLGETNKNPEIGAGLAELERLIKTKTPPEAVSKLARELQRKVIETTQLEVFPGRWPDVKVGQALFVQNCASCHGDTGAGNGFAGKALQPPPANFLDHERMNGISPFAAFNTIRLGVNGTGMVGFQNLSDEEVWALAFYISSLRFGAEGSKTASKIDSGNADVLKRTSSLSDSALESSFSGSDTERHGLLVAARTHVTSDNKKDFLALAKGKLDEAKSDYNDGKFDSAKAKALQAYLEGIEPIEPRARATDPEAVAKLEEKMAAVRGSIEGKQSPDELERTVQAAIAQIDTVAKLIEHQDMSPVVAFFAAFAILMREGFEAVLVILALLGVIRATGSKSAAAAVHGGWIAALGCGFIAWTFSGWVMGLSGAGREMLEGVTSIFAVVVLLYVGFWLHRQSEIGRWKEFLDVKVKNFLHGKNLVGLAAISFFAVFREAFETVLFLRAIWFEGGEATRTALTMGVLTSLALVIALSWVALVFSKRLPLRQLFTVSSVMMLFLATILAGKGFHSIQETGWLGVTSVPYSIRFELAGVYPTAQTLVAQVVVALLVIFLWIYGRKPSAVGA